MPEIIRILMDASQHLLLASLSEFWVGRHVINELSRILIVWFILGGEQLLNLPAVIHFPFFNEESGEQLFPFRTFLMLASIVIQLVVSIIARSIFICGCLSAKYDVFECFRAKDKGAFIVESRLNSADMVVGEETLFLSDSQSIPPQQLRSSWFWKLIFTTINSISIVKSYWTKNARKRCQSFNCYF